MLTREAQGRHGRPPSPAASARPRRRSTTLVAYFEGEYVPLRDAKVSIMTHAFMYGTAVFEGIRAYWNAEQGVLYGLKLREHMERIRRNAGMLLMDDLPPVDELVRIDRRDDPPQRLPRGRLHPAVLLQVRAGRSASGSTTSTTSSQFRGAVRQLHRHRARASG